MVNAESGQRSIVALKIRRLHHYVTEALDSSFRLRRTIKIREILHLLAWVMVILTIARSLTYSLGRPSEHFQFASGLEKQRQGRARNVPSSWNPRRRRAPSKKNIFLIKLFHFQLSIQQLLGGCVGGFTLISSLFCFMFVVEEDKCRLRNYQIIEQKTTASDAAELHE